MHKLSAHRATIYWVLIVLIFFIPSVSGCGGSGGGFDNSTGFRGTERSGTSNGKALTPNVSSTPSNPIFAPGVNHAFSSPAKILKSASISLPAGSTITIKSFSSDAAATNIFGYYDPETGNEVTLTADCPASVQAGETFGPYGPYQSDVTMVFWFYSTWTSSPGKLYVEAVDTKTYNINCEDWNDDDYNDYVAQATIQSSLPKVKKIEFKDSWPLYEKNNQSINPVWEENQEFKGVMYLKSMSNKESNCETCDYDGSDDQESVISDTEIDSTRGKKATIKVTFELSQAPSAPITYTMRTESEDKLITVKESKEVVFSSSESTAEFELVLPQNIQKIDKFTWYCKKSGDTEEKQMEEIDLSKDNNFGGVYVTLTKPWGIMNKALRIEPLYIACINTEGLTDKNEIRKQLVYGVWTYLKTFNFSNCSGGIK